MYVDLDIQLNPVNEESRVIRVFLSSTFRDFAEERDLLVKKVFPELRRLCRERQVELVEVDLRWGITKEEAQQGEVLPICLGEIDRARPYFMGFIGDRYGWVPDGSQYPAGIVEREPWLREHQGGKSVTELEMLHGVLNNPAMAGRAFFYFRDTKYSQGKGGDYCSEDDASAAKLEALKDRIRGSQFPVVEDYADPQVLADKVRVDLLALIEEEYPADEVPDDLTLERMRHEVYSRARRGLYIGGEQYFARLDAALSAETPRPVLISGEAGLGKSALIASWLQGWRAKYPDMPVILHHLNATAEADDPMHLIRRLGEEAALITGRPYEAVKSKDEILDQMPSILADLSTHAEHEGIPVLIVLDGLERCGATYEDLRWFPKYLPTGIDLLASCSDGPAQEHLQNFPLDWTRIELEPLSEVESRDFIERYLKNFTKSLIEDQAARILAHPLSGRPLWLITLLEELRLFGVHEELEARLETLLSDPPDKTEGEAPTIDDLYEHVLARIELDIDEDYEVAAFKALWASYDGLARSELLELTGMPPAKWAEIQNALDENLFESGGQITFANDFIRKAVEDRYLPKEEDQRAAHRWLGEWFEGREVTLDVAQERVHQWRQAEDKDRLRACLRNPLIHKILFGNRRNLIVSNWLFIVSHESFLLKSCELLCLAEILSTISDYEVSRNLANAVLYSKLEWSGAFEHNPLDGRGGTYTFSVVWAEFITTHSEDQHSKLITELIELSGTEYLNMAALYALCFYYRDKSSELSEVIFGKILSSSPWAKVVLTNLAIELVLMGEEISFSELNEEFWHPFWEYDRAEIDLLKGAMRFMGYNQNDDSRSDCDYYNYLENKRLELLSQTNEPSTANLLSGFWLLDSDRESLHKQLRGSKSEDIDDILMLFLAYPVWTVSDLASDVIFSRLCVSKSLLKRVREAAFDVNGYHAFSAFKCYAKWLERSQDSEELLKLITVASQSDFCQIRGQTAEYMMELLRNTPVSNLRFLYLRFKDSLNIFLCDTDIWSFQEVFHNLHDLDKTLESVGIYWRESLNLEDSKFLKLVSGWNNLGFDWDKFNEQATLRLKNLLPNDGSVKTDLEAFKQLALAGY